HLPAKPSSFAFAVLVIYFRSKIAGGNERGPRGRSPCLKEVLLSSPARMLVSVVPVGLLLAVPVGAQARPVDATAHAAATKARIKLNTVSSPPRTAAPGQ